MRLFGPNDECCVELRMRIPAPPVVDGGTIVIGNEDGSLIMLSIESGSSSMVLDRVGSFSFRRRITSSLKRAADFLDANNSFLTNPRLSLFTVASEFGLSFSLVFDVEFDGVGWLIGANSVENDIDCSSFCKYMFPCWICTDFHKRFSTCSIRLIFFRNHFSFRTFYHS